jgi:hypothetical protein
MKVHLLHVTIYDAAGWKWRTERIRNPSWDDIELAIRCLDRFCYPFIWLWQDPDIDDDAIPEFNVMGGDGEYTMDYGPEGTELRYYDPTRGDEEIKVWQSDQGYVSQAKYCCSSLDIVLRVTRYFAEHGTLDPGVLWQPC